MSDCGDEIKAAHPEVNKQDIEDILLRAKNLADIRAQRENISYDDAMAKVKEELVTKDQLQSEKAQQNAIVDVQKVNNLVNYAMRARNFGEGLLAKFEMSKRNFTGSRNSIFERAVSMDNGLYTGPMWSKLEQAGVAKVFAKGGLEKQIYVELGELGKYAGKSGKSGSKEAQQIAQIIHPVLRDINARINRAGGYRGNIPGYIAMQTHNMDAIRVAGKSDVGAIARLPGESDKDFGFRKAGMFKEASYQAWSKDVKQWLDPEATYEGANPDKWLRNSHNSLYTGVHGVLGDEGVNAEAGHNLTTKVSQERILHFKDAESAYEYNQKYGTRDLKEQILTTIKKDSRSIAIMEELGSNPENNIATAIAKLKEIARERPDGAEQVDSINEAKIWAAYRAVNGENDIPANPSLARAMGNIKTIVQMSKMGSVAITKLFADKAFMHVAMMRRSVPVMDALATQVTGMAGRSANKNAMLRSIGVGMDGLRGNALSRYSDFGLISGPVNKAQKAFFDYNFLNYVNDAHAKTMGEVVADQLGQNSHLKFEELPDHLKRDLPLYEIGPDEWEYIRKGTIDVEGNKWVTPDGIRYTHINMEPKKQDELTSRLLMYYADQVNSAVPKPGAAEIRLSTMDTKAGTALGETVRLLAMFKMFPITVANRVLTRDVYGNGAQSMKEWMLNDHKGKFNMAQLIALTTIGGYLSMSTKDALAGKTPRPLWNADSDSPNWKNINEAAVRGGGLGMLGDMVAKDYERNYTSFLETVGGPAIGQLDTVAQMVTKAKQGQDVTHETSKLVVGNLPLINMFYIRPILDYYVLWNMQEMMNPGTIKRMQKGAEKNQQSYFIEPNQK